jgi:hypothetical protein
MRRKDNDAAPAEAHGYRLPEDGPLPDLPLYEQLIDDGVAAADSRGTSVDHVTARRLAIWLAARPQPPALARTGAISSALKTQLRIHARSANHGDQPQAARLMQYCIARGAAVGPIGENFGAACDRLDQADVMLADLHNRNRHGLVHPEPSWPETDGPSIVALAGRDPESQTVSLVLDQTTANIVMFAVAAHVGEREAHIREVERFGQSLPEGSYGRRNRYAIVAREARVASRLRAVERAYRTAIDRDAMINRPEVAQPVADREIEM